MTLEFSLYADRNLFTHILHSHRSFCGSRTWTVFFSFVDNSITPGYSSFFNLLRRRLTFSLRQELSSSHHMQPVTKIVTNRTSDCGLINMQLTNECIYRVLLLRISSIQMTNLGFLIMLCRRQCLFVYETVST